VHPITSPMNLRIEVAAAIQLYLRRGLADVQEVSILQGNGNVIAVVELADTTVVTRAELSAAARLFCDAVRVRRIDGVLYFYPHTRLMRFFDRDGTWEAMCGNGLRCVAQYAYDGGYIGEADTIITEDGPRTVRMIGKSPEVGLGEPRELCQIDRDRWFVYDGVAHLVIFQRCIDRTDAVREGRRLRYDQELCERLGHPEGLHVNFVAAKAGMLRVRTYEVGVEDETLSCGTGVAAAGYVSWMSGRTSMPVNVYTAGGMIRVSMRGAEICIHGEVSYLLMRVTGGYPHRGHLPEAVA
jgi:diaminopimelate epimerase